MVAGLEVYGAGIAPQTTVASVGSTSLVLSQAPTAALGGTTLFFNAPDVNNVLTQVSGGAANVNTSSLTVVSQPPVADGYLTTSTTSTTGIVNMYQALNPVDSTFSATLAYCAPGFTYPSAGNCTTFIENYKLAASQDMGEQIVEIIETENIYEGDSQAYYEPSTAAQGSTITLTEAPTGGAVPTTSSGATVNYIDGDTYIMPIPSGLTYVPGSVALLGGDAVTSASGATTAKYCTAAGTGCTAQMTGNYKTTYPYIEEQLGSASTDEAKGGQLHTLPAITAQFVASGAAGSVQNQYDTEYLVDTNVTDILNINVAFDGYPNVGEYALRHRDRAIQERAGLRGSQLRECGRDHPIGDGDVDRERDRFGSGQRRSDGADHRLRVHQRRRRAGELRGQRGHQLHRELQHEHHRRRPCLDQR